MPLKKTVKFDGVPELMRDLRNPRLLDEPMVELLTESSRIATQVATERLEGGTGVAVRSVFARVKPREARVGTMMPATRTRSIESGRKPGQFNWRQLLPQIIRWKEAVGAAGKAVVLAQGIARRGVQGRFFIGAAVTAVHATLPGLTARMGQRVESQWRGLGR